MKVTIIGAFLAIFPGIALCQAQSNYKVLQLIKEQWQGDHNHACNYHLKAVYPNGKVDTMSGVYVHTDNLVYNSNREVLTIQNSDWYYKVNFKTKTVAIAKLSHKIPKPAGAKGNSYLNNIEAMADSMVLNHSKVSIKTAKEITELEFLFDKTSLVNNVKITYNNVSNNITNYSAVIDQECGYNEAIDDVIYMKQHIECDHFSYSNLPSINLLDFFIIKDGKVQLRKYAGYKTKFLI